MSSVVGLGGIALYTAKKVQAVHASYEIYPASQSSDAFVNLAASMFQIFIRRSK